MHRYLSKVDCSRHISLQKIHFHRIKCQWLAQNMAGGLTMQAGWSQDVPALNANTFAAATNRTNKTDWPLSGLPE
jgi:hypothetical protein